VRRPARLLGLPLRWVARRWTLLVACAVLAYFAYHAVHGGRGLLAWVDRNREVEAARAELGAVTDERATLERRLRDLQPGRADRDILEEELRQLGYIRQNEVIVLTPDEPPPPVR
jgi:cell division protein FtsB